jgi:hypothetical protein
MMTGGCLCGAVRYEAEGEADWTALCYCRDCQRTSGSGYVPVMGVKRSQVRITGEMSRFGAAAANGNVATRHFCPTCGSLVMGGNLDDAAGTLSLYIGTLDDPSVFKPQIAIFTRHRLPWDCTAEGVTQFDRMPGMEG